MAIGAAISAIVKVLGTASKSKLGKALLTSGKGDSTKTPSSYSLPDLPEATAPPPMKWIGQDTGFYGHALAGRKVDSFYKNVQNVTGSTKTRRTGRKK